MQRHEVAAPFSSGLPATSSEQSVEADWGRFYPSGKHAREGHVDLLRERADHALGFFELGAEPFGKKRLCATEDVGADADDPARDRRAMDAVHSSDPVDVHAVDVVEAQDGSIVFRERGESLFECSLERLAVVSAKVVDLRIGMAAFDSWVTLLDPRFEERDGRLRALHVVAHP